MKGWKKSPSVYAWQLWIVRHKTKLLKRYIMGGQNVRVSHDINVKVPQTASNRSTLGIICAIPGFILNANLRYLIIHVHWSSQNGQGTEKVWVHQMINGWMDNKNVVYKNNGILCIFKEKKIKLWE